MTIQMRAFLFASVVWSVVLSASSCAPSAVQIENETASAPGNAPPARQPSAAEVQCIDPNKLQPGPVRRDTLTDEQMARIQSLQSTFLEVDGQSVDQWVDNFKRDFNPDRELAVWERMARAYEGYCSARDLTLEQKREVYKVILLRSMAPRDEVLQRLELKTISTDDAIEIMNGFAQ